MKSNFNKLFNKIIAEANEYQDEDDYTPITIEQFLTQLKSVDLEQLDQDEQCVYVDIQGIEAMPVIDITFSKNGLYLECANDDGLNISEIINDIESNYTEQQRKQLYIYVENAGYDYPTIGVEGNVIQVVSVDQ